jgi:hypothetical protein
MPVVVSDPFGAASDPAMPTLALALDGERAGQKFRRRLRRLAGPDGRVRLQAIRVFRYKPGRRCVIEYDVRVRRPDAPVEEVTLIGKVRARRYGKAGHRLLDALRDAGFGEDSADSISVPTSIAVLSKFRLWLQRKVPGVTATQLLAQPKGVALVQRIAEAAHKLHRTSVPAERRHTMADELDILHKCVPTVAQAEPSWAGRIERLLEACDRLGAATPTPVPCGIHRDYYSDQVIVDGPRLYLIDFDLYCYGDPGLDIGNFIGHMSELSLRTLGDPAGLVECEHAMEERFVELSGEATRAAVRAYSTLTLVRHVYLSTKFLERRPLTSRLLELCEERLGLRGER